MDSNKDEAKKCMMIGKTAMEAGDRGRAIKFFTKAQRLYPNAQVDAYLSAVYEGSGKQAADDGHSVPGCDTPEKELNAGLGRRNGFHPTGSSASTAASDASAEQIETVLRIKKTRDYYEILGLSKNCSEDDVKKAYRKLSLKVHPDKNKAAGAEEAFKAVSRAFSCLSDAELREKYDKYGPEEEHAATQQAQQVRRRRTGPPVFYEDLFEANDVFNSFFFGMQHPNGGFRRAPFARTPGADARGRQEGQPSNLLGLLQLLPIIALLFLNYFPFSQPVYQLESMSPYQYHYKTKGVGVNYYVKSVDFDREYPPGSQNRKIIEGQVERDYREILAHNCRVEQGYSRWGQSRETPNCEKLRRFHRTVRAV